MFERYGMTVEDAVVGLSRSLGKVVLMEWFGWFWLWGTALATVVSYDERHSVLWSAIAGALSWLYIIGRAVI